MRPLPLIPSAVRSSTECLTSGSRNGGWTAGAVFQTVWNAVEGHAPGYGIKDHGVFYFDDTDLSWEAEDAVIRRAADLFHDLPAHIELRNEARVHL